MNLALRSGGALALLALLAGGGCEWNEKHGDFATYAEFSASPWADNGTLPANLVPRSARNIHVVYNIDSTEAQAEFDFAAADEAMLQSPFLTPGLVHYRDLIRDGQIAPAQTSTAQALVRCGTGAVEFLLIEHHDHARYWTSWDRQLRASSCPRTFNGGTKA